MRLLSIAPHAQLGCLMCLCFNHRILPPQVPFLGSVPLDPALSRAGEEGRSVFDSAAGSSGSSAPALQAIIDKLLAATGGSNGPAV